MTRGATALAVSAAMIAAMGGCQRFPSASEPPATVTITAFASFPAAGGPKCTASPQWNATPITVPPTGAGTADPITESEDRHEFSPTGDQCRLQHTFSSLRPGRWRIALTGVGNAGGVCEASFPAGTKSVGFGSSCPAQ